jgi:glycerol-3-phosphate dehydrogenase
MDASRLGPEYRRRAGLSVALVEKRDFAAGTSSRSSKLIHGGLRYLERGRFGLVGEARTEQALLLTRLCPHLVQPVSFLFPLRHRVWERAYVGAGVLLYDLLARPRVLPRHRHLSRRAARALFPSFRPDALTGAIQYYDALVDDARHTLTLARSAALHGAALATSVRAVGFARSDGRVRGVLARCLESGTELEIRARQLINATGVWTEDVHGMAGGGRLRVRSSKGIHLVVPGDRIRGASGLIARTEKSVLFVIPWKQSWIIGTTDTDWNLDRDHPAASRCDIDYLLERVNALLEEPLTREDVQGVYAGLRPLLYGESDATSQLSREHAVSTADSGLISVAGGKYTTYRVMARDAIDVAAGRLGRAVPPSCTDRTPLLGADGFEAVWNRRTALSRESGLSEARVEHLLRRYGVRIFDLLELIESRPELGKPLSGAEDYLAVEALYATTHEAALHLDDILTRRTRISIETPDRGLCAARPVCDLMAEVLGWDAATRAREIEHYEARVAAERESQEQLDDRTADAARLGAPDVRTAGARTRGASAAGS